MTDPRAASSTSANRRADGSAERCEYVAQAFHETYERLAVEFGYETRPESAVPWADVPEKNQSLMIATVSSLMEAQIIPTRETDEQPCSWCGDSGWVNDENWEPTYLGPGRQTVRNFGDGILPCRFCNPEGRDPDDS